MSEQGTTDMDNGEEIPDEDRVIYNDPRLEDCPHCGEDTEYGPAVSKSLIGHIGVCCHDCGAWGQLCTNEEGAIEAWNKRDGMTELRERAEAAEKALAERTRERDRLTLENECILNASRDQPIEWKHPEMKEQTDTLIVVCYVYSLFRDQVQSLTRELAEAREERDSEKAWRQFATTFPEEHISWLKYKRHPNGSTTIHIADSDETGAFKVWRRPDSSAIADLQSRLSSAEEALKKANERIERDEHLVAYAPENAFNELTKNGIEFIDGSDENLKRKIVFWEDSGDSSVGIPATCWWQTTEPHPAEEERDRRDREIKLLRITLDEAIKLEGDDASVRGYLRHALRVINEEMSALATQKSGLKEIENDCLENGPGVNDLLPGGI